MASQPISADMDDPVAETMDDGELVSILAAHAAQAIGYQPGGTDDITSEQELALNYYNRIMPDVPAQEGSSSVVDGTVALVVDNALAACLKPFVSSDETVRFAPRQEEDIETAEQATEYVNYVFNCDNPGFLILHDWFKDALLTKLGVVKVWWEENKRLDKQEVVPENELQAAYLRTQENYLGEENGVTFIGQVIDDGRVKVQNVPPEEFRITPMARSVEDAIYTAHVPSNVTRSDLVEMGFDHEIVETLPAWSGGEDSQLRIARYQDENYSDEHVVTPHKSQDRIELRDEYIRVDYDDDGVSELRRVMRVGDVVLLNEEIKENPFATLCPVPMPHKVHGLSLADLALQEQRINTVLWRQTLDNLYKSNNPRPVLGEGAHRADGATYDSLNDNAPGAAIEVASIDQFRFDAVPFTAAHSISIMEAVAARVEQMTGVSRAGQGLDTNSLSKSGQMTATEMAMIQGGKNARIEMVARIFAETGVKRLFKLILDLVSRHQQQARIVRLRNKFVPMDPSGWPEMDVTISVGLGIGDKSEQLMLADSVLQTMAQLAQSPYASLVGPEQVYKAVQRKFVASGIKNTDEYLVEPQGPVEQPPSPEMVKVQGEMQMQQAKLQGEQQAMAAKLDLQRQESELKIELARQEAAAEAELAHQKAAAEMALAEQKLAFEQQQAEQRMELDMRRAAWDADRRDKESDAKLSANRPGGSLAE